nr:MAG TPA: hypothetical protein [Caudoviricetes sp.]
MSAGEMLRLSCAIFLTSFLVHEQRRDRNPEVLRNLEQLRNAGPVHAALPLPDCAVAQARRLF